MRIINSLTLSAEGNKCAAKWLPCALLLIITFALYGASVYFNFVWDDSIYIRENYRIRSLDWLHIRAIWTSTYLGHYAPLHHTLLSLLYRVSGMEPFGYHLGQVLIHSACVCLLYALLSKIEPARVALLAALLFAVHPTNIETVAWISETKSTLSLLLVLLSFWFFIRFRETNRPFHFALVAIFLDCSALAKINTVVAPVIFLLYDYKTGDSFRQLRWRSLAILFVLSGILVLVHIQAFGNSGEMLDGSPYSGLGTRLMNFPLLISFYLEMIVLPFRLSAWELFPVQQSFNWIVALAWTGLALLLVFLVRAGRDTQFWALWILVFLLPVLQIVAFPIWVADRYLYIPLIGGATLVARLFFWCWDWLVQPGTLAVAVVAALAWRTHRHLPVWRDELALWSATIPTCMTSAYCHSSFGLALMSAGQFQRGGDELVRAVELQPTPLFLMYLGDAFTRSARNYPEAVRIYLLALKDRKPAGQDIGGPRLAKIHAKLARAYILSGQLDLASQAIQTGREYDWRYPGVWVMDVFLQWKRGNLDGARASLSGLISMLGQDIQIDGMVDQYWGDRGETRKMLAELKPSNSTIPK
ncbi:MAG: hypothetical protein EXQ56_00875 [Acidobacteria bacterium]|nr:hypothetical protein [Acidobacteriota bacterium]